MVGLQELTETGLAPEPLDNMSAVFGRTGWLQRRETNTQ